MTQKLISFLLMAFMMPAIPTVAREWDEQLYKQIEQSIQTPDISGKDYDITKFGAKASANAAKNQKAIQKAIDECTKNGGGRVIIPAGQTFKTGAIQLKSHVNLHVEQDAVLLFVFQPELYPIVETSWEGLLCFNLSPCVYAFEATDLAITGKGIIDGGGSNENWWSWCGKPKYGWQKGMPRQQDASRMRIPVHVC